MPYTLAYKDRYRRVDESLITSDTSDSIAFPYMAQEEDNKFVAVWTGTQFTQLFSSVYMGANLMFPEEANEIIWQLLKVVHKPLTLEEEDDGCINYLPYAPFLFYHPQNPYTQPDFTPDDYLVPPFFVNSEFGYPSEFGYLATDVFINSGALNIDPIDLITLNLPQIQIKVKGSGQIELDLLAVASGSMAVIKAGSPPNIIDIIDGIADTGATVVDLELELAIPPESDIVHNHEENIEAESGVETIVYVVFVPVVDDSLIPLRLGGGIRQIGLCGFEEGAVTGWVEDVRWNDSEYTLEQRKNGIYEPVTDFNIFMGYFDAVALDAQTGHAKAQTALNLINDDIFPVLDNHEDRIDILEGQVEDIATLQATHDTSIANLASRMDTAESDIDALDARLDALEALDFWTHTWDFTTSDFGIIPTNATYTAATGFVHTWSGSADVLLQNMQTGANANQIYAMEVGYSFQSGNTGAPTNVPEQRLNGVSPYSTIRFTGSGNTGEGLIKAPNNPSANYELGVQDFGDYTITYIKFFGIGDNPF